MQGKEDKKENSRGKRRERRTRGKGSERKEEVFLEWRVQGLYRVPMAPARDL